MKINQTRGFINVATKYVGVFVCCWLTVNCSAVPERLEGKPEHHTTEGFRNTHAMPTASSKGALFVLRSIYGGQLFIQAFRMDMFYRKK